MVEIKLGSPKTNNTPNETAVRADQIQTQPKADNVVVETKPIETAAPVVADVKLAGAITIDSLLARVTNIELQAQSVQGKVGYNPFVILQKVVNPIKSALKNPTFKPTSDKLTEMAKSLNDVSPKDFKV